VIDEEEVRDGEGATASTRGARAPQNSPNTRSFIETQFPVSRLSKESYKERKSNYSQTLTGLGKWWGRKPLILCRATILGLLMPASNDPERDREIFLKILTMDRDGLLLRFHRPYAQKELRALCTTAETKEWERRADEVAAASDHQTKKRLKSELSDFLDDLQRRVFLRRQYEDQIARCDRPEQIDGPSEEAWKEINAHLGTRVTSLPELVRELGERRFGHVPRVGDAFCGGGSIPFEAARIGCDAYGSDLNPVAALLTWAALNIVGGGEEVAEQVRKTQREIYDAVNRQVTAWGIEHRTEDVGPSEWKALVAQLHAGKITTEEIQHRVPRADAYLYCVEVICPETGWRVPLAPSWMIGEKSRCVAKLVPDAKHKRYDIAIESGVSEAEMATAEEGTIKDGYVVHPELRRQGKQPASIDQVRLAATGKVPGARYHANGLRLWENDDVVPRPEDAFQERLYCVRWVAAFQRENAKGETVWDTCREYRAPTEDDLEREAETLRQLRESFAQWQKKGFLPSMVIEPGAKTDEPIRTRGWTHWHHLFNPRQLVVLGNMMAAFPTRDREIERAATLLAVDRCLNFFSRITRWVSNAANEKGADAFSNQALNTLIIYVTRGFTALNTIIEFHNNSPVSGQSWVAAADAREWTWECDIHVTDPPYADAVNYHELSEYFLSWHGALLPKLFPDWSQGSRRALAVAGVDDAFRRSMVDCYRRVTAHMPDHGLQVVMFTHQDAAVWADLALILWAAGLRVSAAWCVATETDNTSKRADNYVQGTVLLVLRKQMGGDTAFLDEVYPEVEAEVRRQLDAMTDLDEKHATSPDFSDTDYQLAAYAAALRVLTRYAKIEDIDVAYELSKPRVRGADKSPIERAIDQAVKIAADHLVPKGFDQFTWRTLTPAERFYLKGLDLESHGEFRTGAYQELARGFGLREYTPLFGSGKANETRLKTATEFGKKMLGDPNDLFSDSLVRHILFAIREVTAAEGNAEPGRVWLRNEVQNYWNERKRIIEILRYLARLEVTISAWETDGKSAALLAGAVDNDSV
jgi:adenine-specific DNA methylase